MSIFTTIPEEQKLYSGDVFFIIKDRFPVSPGHMLIISSKIRENFFELSVEEKEELLRMIDKAKELIEKEYKPDGYNIGMNCGEAAGQTVFHFHCHIIPRYFGDMANPRGGVRHCIDGKGNY